MPVEKLSQELESVSDKLDIVDALWKGTQAMRAAGTTYLPREEAEEIQDYNRRKDMSFLTNFFKKTVKVMAGRLFQKPVNIVDAPAFEQFDANVDLEGRNLHRFAYDLTQKTIRDGIRFIVVDAPSSEGVRTAAEERALGIRPYFVEVDVRSVLGWRTEDRRGQRVITQFRYMETVTEPEDEFSTVSVDQIRVIEANQVTLYRKNKKGEWVLYQEIPTSVGFVPVVPVYAGRQGFMDFEPPLMDLAWLNLEHWQKSSDQSNILHVARVPFIMYRGYSAQYDSAGNEVPFVVGPNAMAKDPNPQADMKYVEHTGAAIGSGRQDLMDIEARAVAIGADFATPRKSGEMTATEAAIGEAGDVSDLSALAQNIKDALELALSYVGEMTRQPFTGEVSMSTELGIIHTPVNVQELVKLRMSGDISREGLFEILNQEWDTQLNPETERERLETEPPVMGGMDAFAGP